MAVSFICTTDDLIFTREEAATLNYRCPECRDDLEVLDDPQNRTAADFRREAEKKGKKK